MLQSYSLNQIDESVMRRLIELGVQEGQHLDFKRDPYSPDGKGSGAIAIDVCAFANAEGGDIVVGIGKEKSGAPYTVKPIEGDPDHLLVQFQQAIDSGVTPRIQGLSFKSVQYDGGWIIVIRVPRSWQAPHARVIDQKKFVFHIRRQANNSELRYDEVQRFFMRGLEIEDRVATFFDKRLSALDSGHRYYKASRPSSLYGGLVVHIAQATTGTSANPIDVGRAREKGDAFRPPMLGELYGGGGYYSFSTLEGRLFYYHEKIAETDGAYAYTQVFRDGSIETIVNHVVNRAYDDTTIDGRKVYELCLISLWNMLNGLRFCGATYPLFVKMSLLDVAGTKLNVGPESTERLHSDMVCERPLVSLPNIVFERDLTHDEFQEKFTKYMSILWNAFGYDRCEYNDEQFRERFSSWTERCQQ